MWEENMDPKLPLLDELITVRALLGEDPGEWGSVKLTLSPCLRLLFAGYAQDQADQGRRAPRLIDLISHLEHLSAATPSLEEFRDAPLLDEWSAGVGGDGCARLFGRVTGHPRLHEGARIYTSPYLQVDPAAGWARTWSRFYQLGRHDRRFLAELIMDGVVGPTEPIELVL